MVRDKREYWRGRGYVYTIRDKKGRLIGWTKWRKNMTKAQMFLEYMKKKGILNYKTYTRFAKVSVKDKIPRKFIPIYNKYVKSNKVQIKVYVKIKKGFQSLTVEGYSHLGFLYHNKKKDEKLFKKLFQQAYNHAKWKFPFSPDYEKIVGYKEIYYVDRRVRV